MKHIIRYILLILWPATLNGMQQDLTEWLLLSSSDSSDVESISDLSLSSASNPASRSGEYIEFEKHINAIKNYQIPMAWDIIMQAIVDLQLIPCTDCASLKRRIEHTQELDDLYSIPETYGNRGCFLVMLNNDKVIGTGALIGINETTCELKHMHFLRDYRYVDLRQQLVEELLTEAPMFKYNTVRINIYNTITQSASIRLYEELGFRIVSPAPDSFVKLCMEKKI